MVVFYLWLFAGGLIAGAVHQVGHAIGARLAGSRILSVVFGRGRRIGKLNLAGVPWVFHALPLGVAVIHQRNPRPPFAARAAGIAVAGPAANLLLAIAMTPFAVRGSVPAVCTLGMSSPSASEP